MDWPTRRARASFGDDEESMIDGLGRREPSLFQFDQSQTFKFCFCDINLRPGARSLLESLAVEAALRTLQKATAGSA